MSTLAHPQVQRSLAAIAITDAVGFSKWMSRDEDTALAIINRDLQLIKSLCAAFEGKILKTTGDGVLMYFISAVQAASCAIEIQKKFATFAQDEQANEHFMHRVGVHLGDIFFNEEDMMGTGINIAARLESEAKPGAICMSQVVYEVVKYRLKLDVVYAGELSLKNIEQSVSAYHVWPPNMQPNKSPAQFNEAIFSLVTPLNKALKVFSSHPERHRIKTLLYAAYQGVWENNSDVLDSVSLKLLVESLTNRSMNLAGCQGSLNATIKTLNQPDSYIQVAKIILENIKDFYVERSNGSQIDIVSLPQVERASKHSQDIPQRSPIEMWNSLSTIIRSLKPPTSYVPITRVISSNLRDFRAESSDGSQLDVDNLFQLESILKQHDRATLYREIASRLDSSKEYIRIKQLLYCVCCSQWESHIDRVRAIPMLSLVQELHQQVTSLESLQNRLHRILSHLKCKASYTPIASEIFRESRLLYSNSKHSSTNIVCFRRRN